MKYILTISFALCLLSVSAVAQDHSGHSTPVPDEEIDCTDDPNIKFGYSGYMHCALHPEGTVQKLMEVTGSNCCDGGTGEECRGTEIRFAHGGFVALIDGIWCAIPENVTIHYDIPFPNGVFAVICADAPGLGGIDPITKTRYYCPAIYCAAAAPGL